MMHPRIFPSLAFVVAFSLAAGCNSDRTKPARSDDDAVSDASDADRGFDGNHGIPERIPWTTSKIQGSPEPPPPYRTDRIFPKLKFNNPVLIKAVPGTKRYLVAEQKGKISTFVNDPEASQSDLVLDVFPDVKTIPEDGRHVRGGECYGVAFHPKFLENRYVYVCYVMSSKESGKQQPDGSRVSRFTLSATDPPKLDPASEQVVFTWLGGGHNGGCLEFGPDGYLYISTGDGSFPNPPDALLAGQDETRVLSSVLRIDVDHPEGDRPYSIPTDNPLVEIAGARGEKWAYGFRNPWRMTFDSETGDLWLGDVGWELYEMVHNVEKGGNYGWSVTEGRQSVRPELKRGPTPILPPAIDLPHSMAASVTGGYVYRGKELPELVGKYVFGDWETRRMWAATWDRESKTVSTMEELVEPSLRIVCFGETPERELLIMDYDDGSIHQLVRNDVSKNQPPFPRKLSETGLYDSTERDILAPGVVPFSVNVPMWEDGLAAVRMIALPESTSVIWHKDQVPIPGTIFNRVLEFPKDAVLARTVSTAFGAGFPRRRVETQILHFNGRVWRGYTYRWNSRQTDADLVEADGLESTIHVRDPRSVEKWIDRPHFFASRAACVRCHNPWAQHTLAFNIPQINRSRVFHTGFVDHQLRVFEHIGILKRSSPEDEGPTPFAEAEAKPLLISQVEAVYRDQPRLSPPFDDSIPLDLRARSYLQANCSHCHRMGGGGTADIDLRFDFPLDKTKAVGVRPMQGTFGIHDAQIVAPGDPFRSTLYYRMSKVGKGRMPHIGSQLVDDRGLRLIYDWIRELPPHSVELATLDRLKSLDESTAVRSESLEAKTRIRKRAVEIARRRLKAERAARGEKEPEAPGRVVPIDADMNAAAEQDVAEAPQRASTRETQRNEAIDRLLETASSSLMLARAMQLEELSPRLRAKALEKALKSSDPQVLDLFEQFVPPEQRAKKLGTVVRPQEILAAPGDAERGRVLFFDTPTIQCKNCHRIGEQGTRLGPDLTQIAKTNTRAQILESLLEPSRRIDPKFVTYLVETKSGKVVTGLLSERNDTQVVLRNAKNEEVRIPQADVETLVPQRQSLMPDLQLRDLTKEQAADMLEYLSTLK